MEKRRKRNKILSHYTKFCRFVYRAEKENFRKLQDPASQCCLKRKKWGKFKTKGILTEKEN